MLSEINEKYQSYKEIHNRVLPILDGDKSSELARILLENSLYLSVFTTFENFLKNLIDNYIYNKEKAGVKFIDLSERIAHSLFSNKESQIKFIFDDKNKDKNKSFDTFFKWLTEDVDKKTSETHIHFEFLHKDKLNGYYKDLFQRSAWAGRGARSDLRPGGVCRLRTAPRADPHRGDGAVRPIR